MLLGAIAFNNFAGAVSYPLILGGISIIASIIGTFFVKLGASQKIMPALYKGLIASGVLACIAFYFVTVAVIPGDASTSASRAAWRDVTPSCSVSFRRPRPSRTSTGRRSFATVSASAPFVC